MENMKKSKEKDMMREEYDFTGGIRGKYAKRFSDGSNIIVLSSFIQREETGEVKHLGKKGRGRGRMREFIMEPAKTEKDHWAFRLHGWLGERKAGANDDPAFLSIQIRSDLDLSHSPYGSVYPPLASAYHRPGPSAQYSSVPRLGYLTNLPVPSR